MVRSIFNFYLAKKIGTNLQHNEPSDSLYSRTNLTHDILWYYRKLSVLVPGNKCPVQNCDIAYDKSLFKEANAVVFHSYGFDAVSQSELKLLSRERRQDQIWIYFNHSPPSFGKPHASFFNGFFNWTMTYQSDSDIVVPYSWELGTWQRRSELDEPYKTVDYTKGKDKMVFAEINRCGLPRDKFIKKLQENISIDVYGACSKNFHKNGKVLPKGSKEQLDLKKRYKFYFAAEREFCDDFVSQRFYNVLFNGDSVPIVLGGADYKRLVIPESYIDALSFKTVEELADYIKYLDRNDDEYRKYQNWRKDYILGPSLSWTCEICKKLNKHLSQKIYSNLGSWFDENKCGRGLDLLKKLLK